MASNLELKRAVALALGYEEIKQANGRYVLHYLGHTSTHQGIAPLDLYLSAYVPDWPDSMEWALNLFKDGRPLLLEWLERGQFAWVCVIDGQEALDDEPARAVCLAWLASKGVVVQ